jgi:hypothetical protein
MKKLADELFPNKASFYPVLQELARAARKKNGTAATAATQKIETIDEMFKDKSTPYFKDRIAGMVRVPATKGQGEVRGSGLDEIFQTSKTTYWLRWSAGMLTGKDPVSKVLLSTGDFVKFTPLDLQEKIRLPTSAVLTKQGGGHTGALDMPNTIMGHVTKGQDALHRERQARIEKAETPLEALHFGLSAHLDVTPNVGLIEKMFDKGADVYGKDFADKDDKKDLIERFGRERDAKKDMYLAVTHAMPLKDPFRTPQAPSPFKYQNRSSALYVFKPGLGSLKSKKSSSLPYYHDDFKKVRPPF